MEDRVTSVPEFNSAEGGGGAAMSYFGVYDGHSGTAVCEALHDTLHEQVKSKLSAQGVLKLEFPGPQDSNGRKEREEAVSSALKEAFLDVEGEVIQQEQARLGARAKHEAFIPAGSTALVSLLFNTKAADGSADGMVICTANVGDCRAVLCRRGTAVPISTDHKASDENERKRIYEAGGFVSDNQRLNGVIAVARSFGDIANKPQASEVVEKMRESGSFEPDKLR